jgi:glutamyl-tRNA reductase
VANRTFERAVEVAGRFKGAPVSFDEIDMELSHVDIVIASTASAGYVIHRDQVKQCLKKRRNRPLFFIDIAVPRDVEPQVNDLGNVYLYDIDDLRGVVALNLAQRQEEAVKAGRIVEEEVGKFESWLKTLAVVPTIVSLQGKAESIVRAEFAKSRSVMDQLAPAQHQAVETLVRSIVEKVLNDPIVFLKERAGRPTANTYLDLTKRLFQLNGVETEHEEKVGHGGD